MRIRGIDFPEPLLAAQQAKRLVVFAGAGVSMGPPSDLPSFAGLTRQIEGWAGVPSQEHEPSERFLGRLAHEGKSVHEQVVRILSNPRSSPTPLHENILNLFVGGTSDIRVVTTNFDPHFETLLTTRGDTSLSIYRAPALPLGNDFNGIVYLHGSVKADPKWIVLTDRDFGRAYLTEGWASRFLRAMFAEYAVLFIGYSHNDTVMHYLSRGLPPEATQPRFALVPEDDNLEYWQYLGIQPVRYARDSENSHSLLIDGVSGWVDWARRGALDTEKRIRELVEGPPPLDKESSDFIEWALKDAVAVRFFVRYAHLPEWLEWVSQKGMLVPLFEFGELPSSSKELMLWVSSKYVLQHPDDVFALIQHHGKPLNPWFVYEITRQLAYEDPRPPDEVFSMWVPILIQNGTFPLDQFNLVQVLRRTFDAGAEAAFIQLFSFVTAPRLELKKPLVWSEEELTKKADIELGYRGDDHQLREIWEKRIKPNLASYVYGIWPVALTNLQATYHLLKSWQKASINGDPVSWHRSAIEPHEQDRFHQAEDFLINVARDCLEWALKNRPDLGEAWTDSISVMEPQVMRRLAVHGVTESLIKTGNAKLEWLMTKDFLLVPGLKHEVFRLLHVAYPLADAGARRTVLDKFMQQIDEQPIAEDDDRERNEYQKFNLLIWLSQAAPDCDDVKQRLGVIRGKHPDFQAREHPDLSHWTSDAEWVGPRSPVTAPELLARRPAEWIEYLLDFKGDTFMGPDRDGLLHALGEAVQQNAEWSFELADILIGQNLWATDLWGSVIRGWGKSTLTQLDWAKIIETLNREQLTRGFPHEISDLLQDGAKRDDGGIPMDLLATAGGIASKVWGQLSSDEEIEEENWLGKAINRPAGKLAFFWLYALSRVCKEDAACAEGIPAPYKERITETITGNTVAAILARVVVVSQLGFLYAKDPDWAREKLIPLLSWEADFRRARQVWDGWLSWGKWSDQLLQEILPFYRQSFSRLRSDLASEQHRFIEHVLAIAVYWMEDPIRDGFIPEFLRVVGEEQRVALASQMQSFLMNMKEEAKAELWSRWLRGYLVGRNEGIPVPYSGKELAETVEWLCELETVFDDAVEVICHGPTPHFEHTLLFHRMKDTRLAEDHPESTATLLAHVTGDTEMLRYHCRDLEELSRRAITAGASAPILNMLCDRLARVGCPEAAELQESVRRRG